MASASGGGNGDGDDGSLGVSCVLRAVDAGQSADQVRQVIDSYAQGSEARRLKAVNCKNNNETPLQAAHRSARGDLVAVLLESGADAKTLGPYCSAMALSIHYGLPQTLRVLLRDKREDANARIHYSLWATVEGGLGSCSSAAHVAVAPPGRISGGAAPPPQLECLDVLVREFGADIHAFDEIYGHTPLHWIFRVAPVHRVRALDALVALGADVNRPNSAGNMPLFWAAGESDADCVRALLSHGATANTVDRYGQTPLMMACLNRGNPAGFPATLAALLSASSPETRRATHGGSSSALDIFIEFRQPQYDPCTKQAIADMLAAGVPVLPSNAPHVFPIAARLAERRWAEVRAVERCAGTTWQEHDETVQLAFDVRELREAEEAVRVREMRVEELEGELRRRGGEAVGGGGSG